MPQPEPEPEPEPEQTDKPEVDESMPVGGGNDQSAPDEAPLPQPQPKPEEPPELQPDDQEEEDNDEGANEPQRPDTPAARTTAIPAQSRLIYSNSTP